MIDWASFTPFHAVAGGALIGLAASLFWLGLGRIAGVSGIVGGLLEHAGSRQVWRWWFLAGLVGGAALAHFASGGLFVPRSGFPIGLLLAGAFLVGVGTSIGSGCTSGHGVCGIARLSGRGLYATAIFMAVAILTVFILRHLIIIGS